MEKKSSSPATPTTPTTFVQADTHTFRELVQKLTGADDNAVQKFPVTLPARYSSSRSSTDDLVGPRKSGFKLQERRHNMRKKLEITLGLTTIHQSSSTGYSPSYRQLLSPVPSPATPLISDTVFSGRFTRRGSSSEKKEEVENEEEDRGIAEKGYYMLPSPRACSEPTPELLPLFPLESPKLQKQGYRDL